MKPTRSSVLTLSARSTLTLSAVDFEVFVDRKVNWGLIQQPLSYGSLFAEELGSTTSREALGSKQLQASKLPS